VQCVRAQFEETAKLAGWGGRPEAELLHQRRPFAFDELLKSLVKGREVGMVGNRVQGGMITLVFLVLPNVDCVVLYAQSLTRQAFVSR
jgi:hypothetical protein